MSASGKTLHVSDLLAIENKIVSTPDLERLFSIKDFIRGLLLAEKLTTRVVGYYEGVAIISEIGEKSVILNYKNDSSNFECDEYIISLFGCIRTAVVRFVEEELGVAVVKGSDWIVKPLDSECVITTELTPYQDLVFGYF